MNNKSSIRIPEKLILRIDEIIKNGYYSTKSEFVTAAIRYGLIFYADLRKVALDGNTTILGIITTNTLPKPINDELSGLDLLLNKKTEPRSVENGKASEETIARYYRAVTQLLVKTYDSFDGKMIQVGFNYSDGLKKRSTVLHKTAYGFNRKMDFVKAAIICLLIKTYESDALYNEIDRYYSELTSFHLKTMSDMLFSFLSGDQIEQLVSDAIDALFEDDEDDDGQDDDEIEGDDAL